MPNDPTQTFSKFLKKLIQRKIHTREGNGETARGKSGGVDREVGWASVPLFVWDALVWKGLAHGFNASEEQAEDLIDAVHNHQWRCNRRLGCDGCGLKAKSVLIKIFCLNHVSLSVEKRMGRDDGVTFSANSEIAP